MLKFLKVFENLMKKIRIHLLQKENEGIDFLRRFWKSKKFEKENYTPKTPWGRREDPKRTRRGPPEDPARMLLNTFSKLKFTMLSNLLLMGFNTWEFLDKTIKNMIYVSKCLKSKYQNLWLKSSLISESIKKLDKMTNLNLLQRRVERGWSFRWLKK